jgi:D-sedoheptulose 7-phosphate isomerase
MADIIKDIIKESIKVKEAVLTKLSKEIKAAAGMIATALKKDGKVMLFGNGGSAADAQHIAAEFVGRFKLERQGLASIALTTNSSIITSIANDYGYEEIFSRQMEAIGTDNDIAIGISTSGNARNVIAGLLEAKRMGLKTIALTGSGGGEMATIAGLALIVPSDNTARVQEAHIVIGHIICELVEQNLFGKQ